MVSKVVGWTSSMLKQIEWIRILVLILILICVCIWKFDMCIHKKYTYMFVILIKCYIKSNGSLKLYGKSREEMEVSCQFPPLFPPSWRVMCKHRPAWQPWVLWRRWRGCPGQSDTSRGFHFEKTKHLKNSFQKKHTFFPPFFTQRPWGKSSIFLLLPPMVPVFSVTFPGERRVTLCKLKCRAVWRFFALRLEGRICSGCNVTVGWLVGWLVGKRPRFGSLWCSQ